MFPRSLPGRAAFALALSALIAAPSTAQDLSRRQEEAYGRLTLMSEQAVLSEHILTQFCQAGLDKRAGKGPQMPMRELVTYMRNNAALEAGDGARGIGRERSQLILYPLHQAADVWGKMQGSARRVASDALDDPEGRAEFEQLIVQFETHYDTVLEQYRASYSSSGRLTLEEIAAIEGMIVAQIELARAERAACYAAFGLEVSTNNDQLYAALTTFDSALANITMSSEQIPADIRAQAECIAQNWAPVAVELQSFAKDPNPEKFSEIKSQMDAEAVLLKSMFDDYRQSLGMRDVTVGETCTVAG